MLLKVVWEKQGECSVESTLNYLKVWANSQHVKDLTEIQTQILLMVITDDSVQIFSLLLLVLSPAPPIQTHTQREEIYAYRHLPKNKNKLLKTQRA